VNTRLAHIISLVFQPLLMPTFLFALLFWVAPSLMGAFSDPVRYQLVFVIFLLTFGIPVLSLLVFKSTGWISDLMLTNRKERVVPFIFIIIFYSISTYFLTSRLSSLDLLVNMIYLTMGLLVASVVVTFWWKISIHSAGMAASSGFLWVLNFLYPDTGLYYPMLVSIIFTGATMTARLQLRVHTMGQVTAGALLGIAISVGGMLFLY